MALETLKDVTEIDGFKVAREIGENSVDMPIFIGEQTNCISFVIQDGPVKNNGVNGCQVDTIIAAATKILDGLNNKFPCNENEKAILHLKDAYSWLKKRKAEREARGVEGYERA